MRTTRFLSGVEVHSVHRIGIQYSYRHAILDTGDNYEIYNNEHKYQGYGHDDE